VESSARDVVILGWWSPVQNRISFLHLLRRELVLDLAAAKAHLDSSLDGGKATVIPASSLPRACELAKEIEAMGAEVLVLSGHIGGGDDSDARFELARIERTLEEFNGRTFPSREERARAARTLCSELRGI
jgi:hypothetical protein